MVKNRIASFPWVVTNDALYYRTDRLKEYGLKAPGDDWAFDDFLALTKGFTKADKNQSYALGLVDTYQALIYSNFSFTVPFTVWMMVGYFSSIPRDLEESAMIDGCNHFSALCRVVLPLAAPGIAATAIFAFVVSWSELLFAISFTTETDMRTLSAGLLYMVGQYEVQWGPLSAGVIMSTVPVAVLFVFLQRHLIHGLTAGAVKG